MCKKYFILSIWIISSLLFSELTQKNLVWERLLDSRYVLAEENKNLKKDLLVQCFFYGVKDNFTKVHPWVQGILSTVNVCAHGFLTTSGFIYGKDVLHRS